MRTVFQVLLLTCVFSQLLAQFHEEQPSGNLCNSQTSCGDCIRANKKCSWCRQDGFDANGRHYRCDFLENLIKYGCDIRKVTNPTSGFNATKSSPLSNARDVDAVQVHPQEIRVRARPNDPVKVNMHFRQAEDYPVDLYYLMDLSFSMKDDRDKLAELGQLLSARMQNMTKNFRLGFGSFVDKEVMPYVSTVPSYQKQPCPSCVAPYGFIHQMTLSTDANVFEQRVRKAQVSGNLDAPEGGFDAIMQAIVCKEKIGWREQARRLLIFSTDAGFHYAGDAKLAGIVEPNDEFCHLDKAGVYTHSKLQDYPSIGQLNRQLRENNINLIFAVTKEQTQVYGELSAVLEGSETGTLANDSANIVDLVAGNYQKITSKVEFVHEAPKEIDVKFYSKCLGKERIETSSCEGLRIGDTVVFETEITLKSCPDRDNLQFSIKPVGINEELVVNVEAVCKCDCERHDYVEREEDSSKCSFQGDHECGQCTCHAGRYGRNCECDAKDLDIKDLDAQCRPPNSTVVCSGRGTCVCGVCECFPRINPEEKVSGKFCECDSFSCSRFEGRICGGHGKCVCGKCECEPGYTGDDCSCQESNSTCVASNGLICNDRGDCKCGRCICHADSLYTGPRCEDCPTCPGLCNEKRDCVQCQAFGTGELDDDECKKCPEQVIIVDEVKEDLPRVKMCQYIDKTDDCKFFFTYEYDESQQLTLKAQRTKDCPPAVKVWAIVLGVVLGILLVGLLLLLIWRLLATIQDRREFAKFMKEREAAKWDTGVNPIYKGPTTTYNNPSYGGR